MMKNVIIYLFTITLVLGCNKKENVLLKNIITSNEFALDVLKTGVMNKQDICNIILYRMGGQMKEYESPYIISKNLNAAFQEEINKLKEMMIVSNQKNLDTVVLNEMNVPDKFEYDSLNIYFQNLLAFYQTSKLPDFKYADLVNGKEVLKKLSSKGSLEDLILIQILKKKALRSEYNFYMNIIEQFPKESAFSKVVPYVYLNRLEYGLGDTVSATIYLTVYDDKQKFKVVGEQFELDSENGVAHYKFKASKKGLIKVNFEILQENKRTGETKVYPNSFEYYVY